MKRRDFLRMTGALGVGMALPFSARAADCVAVDRVTRPNFPLLVTVQAEGGWDPTLFCDPKGYRPYEERDENGNMVRRFVNRYAAGDIRGYGNVRWAPYDFNDDFFSKHFSYLNILNGVNTETISHPVGKKRSWTGVSQRPYPALAALYAAVKGKNLPMSYYSAGGYDFSANLVHSSRIPRPEVIKDLADPNAAGRKQYFDDETFTLLRNFIRQRSDGLRTNAKGANNLPQEQVAASQMYCAHLNAQHLKSLENINFNNLGGDIYRQQARLIVAAYKAGLTGSANIVLPGFDTHSNHDGRHENHLKRLFETVNFLMEEARDINNNLIVVIGSDFGRTNFYNEQNGKDHWPIGTFIVLNPTRKNNDFPGGGHVYGKTNAKHESLNENLKLKTVHQMVRGLLGIKNDRLSQEFTLSSSVT